MLDFQGNLVFNTGANSGIGEALAALFAKRQAQVVSTDLPVLYLKKKKQILM